MSDDLTPQQTDAVRRALRAARHEAPVPADVATRLDATLAGLVADRAAGEAGSTAAVVPLRRRRWPAVLAAAAAVTAIGLAGSQLVDRGGDSGALSTADEAERAPSALAVSPEDSAADGIDRDRVLGQLSAPVRLTPAQRAALAEEGYRRVRPAPELASTLADGYRSAAKAVPTRAPDQDMKALAPGCAPAGLDLPPGVAPTYYLARHDGERVVLVVLPGPEVSAYPCDGGDPTPVPLD